MWRQYSYNHISQISNAIEYLHKDLSIPHKNIKPENVFIKNNNIILSDVGLTKENKNFYDDIYDLGLLLNQIWNNDYNITKFTNLKGDSNNFYVSKLELVIKNCLDKKWGIEQVCNKLKD